jgi:hypothetical protein
MSELATTWDFLPVLVCMSACGACCRCFRAEDTVVINERIRKRQVPQGSHIAASSRKIAAYCGRRAGTWSTSHVLPASRR